MNTGAYFLLLFAGASRSPPPPTIIPDVILEVAPRSTLLVVENRPTTLEVAPRSTTLTADPPRRD